MKTILFYLLTLILLISCSNGKITYTVTANCKNGDFSGDGAYLVNTSNNKKIQFTIKSYLNNQSNIVTNNTYILEPGAQTFLGCTTLDHDYHYEIVGEREIR